MTRRSIKAGEGYVEIGIRNRIAKGAAGVQRDLDKLGRRVNALGGIVGGIGLAMGAPIAFAAKTLAGFDDAMRSVGAISQATDKELAALTMTAKELGRTTSFTAVEVANLMIELSRAGFDPSQVDAMTGSVLALARATGTDAPIAAAIMAAAIRQFGLQAADAGRVADVLTAAANNSFNTVETLGESLKFAAPVAADFNMSIEETLAILGTLGNVGIQGSLAGSALRRLLTLTGSDAERLQRIFGVAFIDAAGNARPLVDVLNDVAVATNDLGSAERAAKFKQAFGLLGITGASAIGKATTATRDLLDTLETASGVAERTATEMDAGLGGSFRKAASAAEGVVIAVAESFGPSLKELTDIVTKNLGGLTAWIGENRKLVAAVAATTIALVGAGAALLVIGTTSQVAAAGIGTLTTTVGLAASGLKILSAISVGVRAAVLATAAAMAIAQGSATGLAIGTALLNAAYGVSPAVAGAVVSSFGLIGAAMTALTTGSGIASIAAGVFSTAWITAAFSAATAWITATAPLLPFIAAGAALVAIAGAIAVALGGVAIASIDFGAAFEKAKSMVGGIIDVLSEVASTLKAVLGSGDYAAMADALWASIRLIFWSGVDGAIDAVKWLWDQAIATSVRFGSKLLSIVERIVKSIASAMMNPFKAGREIRNTIAELIAEASSFDIGAKANDARQDLIALRIQADEQKRLNDLEREAQRIKDESKSPKERNDEKRKRIDELQRGGQLTKDEADKAREQLGAPGDVDQDAGLKKIKALQLEILALEKGAAAANRKRLADEGLNATQIKAVEALQKKKQALEAAKEAQERAQENRVDAIFRKADQLRSDGVKPNEIFRRVMAQIKKDQAKGIISAETATDARRDARSALSDDIERLRDEGRRLAEALRTPGEVLNDKLARIAELQDAKAIDDETALRAEDKARAEFKAAKERDEALVKKQDEAIASQQAVIGPTGTFSATAAAIIGGGPRSIENEHLKATQRVAKNTGKIHKAIKKQDRRARFGA